MRNPLKTDKTKFIIKNYHQKYPNQQNKTNKFI